MISLINCVTGLVEFRQEIRHDDMKFTLKEAKEFSREGLKGYAYNSSGDFSNASAAYVEVTGRHGKVKTTTSDRVYYVLDGNGEFTVGDENREVHKTDVVIIPKNTPYDFKVTDGSVLKMFLVHTPAFDPDTDVKLD